MDKEFMKIGRFFADPEEFIFSKKNDTDEEKEAD